MELGAQLKRGPAKINQALRFFLRKTLLLCSCGQFCKAPLQRTVYKKALIRSTISAVKESVVANEDLFKYPPLMRSFITPLVLGTAPNGGSFVKLEVASVQREVVCFI